jgi:outer membrane protein
MKSALFLLLASVVYATAAPRQSPAKLVPAPVQLDLQTAEQIALRQSPTISEAQFKALAAKQVVRQTRSAFFPQISAEFTGVATGDAIAEQFGWNKITNQDTRLGATGGLNNPTILSRESNGILLSQLLTDFGRTWNLTEASKSLALSEAQHSALARARVLLLVDQGYFQAQQAQAVLRVADETVLARQLLADQVSALAQSRIKSDLDASFARVSLDEAKLLQLEARNRVDAAFAELSSILGYPEPRRFALLNVPRFAAPKANLAALIAQALQLRPEALSLRHQRDAALRLTAAERAARFPKVSLIGAAGRTTTGDPRVLGDYAAAGVNVELPVFTGLRLSARVEETELQAKAAEQAVREIENLIAKDVEVALLNTTNTSDRIDVTASLLANAEQAYDLAESKYQLGITSVVEFSQAQLAKLQAQINHTTATYEYQIDRLVLDFQVGAPKYLPPSVSR